MSQAAPWWIDTVRSRLYRFARPVLGPLYADRSRRVGLMAALSVLTSLAVTLVAPLWSLALGPVLLGVPHLVADVRYLVVQPRLVERTWLWLAALPLAATCVGAPPVVGLLALVPVTVLARGAWWRRVVVSVAGAGLVAAAVLSGPLFTFGFLHLHNLVAVGWWWWFRPRGRAHLASLGLLLAALAFLFTPAALAALSFFGAWEAPGSATSFAEFAQTHAWRWTAVAPNLVLSFAFLQSLHYAMWLRLVPEDARGRPAPRTFRASWEALRGDFGGPLLWAFVVLAVGVAVWGAVDLFAARLGYLRLAAFHGYLELAAAAWFFIEAREPPGQQLLPRKSVG